MMTDKQQIFADEYLIDLNGTRAYKVAYPSCKKDASARTGASKLLKTKKVEDYISIRLDELKTERTADAQEVMEYLTSVIRSESKSAVVVIEGCGDGVSEAKVVEKPPDEKERLKAAELLGKRHGLFTDKLEVSGIEQEKNKLDDLIDQLRGGGDG